MLQTNLSASILHSQPDSSSSNTSDDELELEHFLSNPHNCSSSDQNYESELQRPVGKKREVKSLSKVSNTLTLILFRNLNETESAVTTSMTVMTQITRSIASVPSWPQTEKCPLTLPTSASSATYSILQKMYPLKNHSQPMFSSAMNSGLSFQKSTRASR